MKGPNLRLLPALLIMVMALGLIGCGTQIPSGHRGVFYAKFGDGTQMGTIYPEGFSWHLPWNGMFVYRIQTQESAAWNDEYQKHYSKISNDPATIATLRAEGLLENQTTPILTNTTF